MTETQEKPFKIIFTSQGKLVGRFYMKSYKTACQFIELVNDKEQYFAAILPNKTVNSN